MFVVVSISNLYKNELFIYPYNKGVKSQFDSPPIKLL